MRPRFYFTLFLMGLLVLVIGLSVSLTNDNPLAENKAIMMRCWEEAINKGNLDVVDEIFDANFVYHPNPEMKGTEGVKQLITMYRTAFPDMQITVEDQIAEGDKVVTRWTATGTHKGELMGITPTGKKVTTTGITIDRIANGKIVEEWENIDDLGMMQQLGVIPPLEQAEQ